MNELNSNRENLYCLQVVRGVAAAAVLLHHAYHVIFVYSEPFGVSRPTMTVFPEWLAIGVDLFFVLSGFIMVHISGPYLDRSRTIGDFAAMRFIRIYPMYFVVTIILIFTSALSAALMHGSGSNLKLDRMVASILLLPSFNDRHLVQPVLGVGWTLSYEIFFYSIFAGCIMLTRTTFALVMLLTGSVALVLSLGYVFYDGSSAFSIFVANGILFEFVLGCVVSYVYSAGWLARIPVVLLVALWCGTLVLSLQFVAEYQFRCMSWGLFAAASIALVVRLEAVGLGWWPKPLVVGGNASYSMYLFHIAILYLLVAPVLRHIVPRSDVERFAVLMATWVFLILSTTLIHFRFERPVHSYLLAQYRKSGAMSISRGDVNQSAKP